MHLATFVFRQSGLYLWLMVLQVLLMCLEFK
jgi:hypothetical protein